MLDAAEIRKEIARLEYEESDYKNYAKLAATPPPLCRQQPHKQKSRRQ